MGETGTIGEVLLNKSGKCIDVNEKNKILMDRIEIDKSDKDFIEKELQGLDKIIKINQSDLKFNLIAEKSRKGGWNGIILMPKFSNKNPQNKIYHVMIRGADTVHCTPESSLISFIYTFEGREHYIELYTEWIGGPEDY